MRSNGDWDENDDAIPKRSGCFMIRAGFRTAIGRLSSIIVDSSSEDWYETDSWSIIVESLIVESFVVESSKGTWTWKRNTQNLS